MQTFGRHGSNDLIALENRSDPIVDALRFLGRRECEGGYGGRVLSQEWGRVGENVCGTVDKRANFHRERRAKWNRCGLVGWMRVGQW